MCYSGHAKANYSENVSIDAILYGDGSKIGSLTLGDEVRYASGRMDCGVEYFYPIDPTSIM